jgi:nucleoporin NUP82
MTTNQQVVPIELQIRIPQPREDEIVIHPHPSLQGAGKGPANLGSSTDTSRPSNSSDAPEKTRYKTVMEQRPFIGIPPIQFGPVPPVPRIVVAYTEATPTQLRETARAIAQLAEYHKLVQNMPPLLDTRIGFINEEKSRQSQMLRPLQASLDRLNGGKNNTGGHNYGKAQISAMRLEKMMQIQTALLKRVDSLLQKLMDGYHGALTEGEKAWFNELKRMRKDVIHTGDGSALVSKAETVCVLSTSLP